MKEFIAKFGERIRGVVSGLIDGCCGDRSGGSAIGRGMEQYLWQNKILFKDCAQHVKKVSERVKKAAVARFV